MFIVWGTRNTNKTLGSLAPIWECQHCHNASHYTVFARKQWFTLFWIPVIPLSSEYFVTCPICNYGRKVQKQEAMNMLEQYKSEVISEQQ